MNIGEFLKANYPGGIKEYGELELDGIIRGYFVKGINGDELYIPNKSSGNVKMLSYIPGSSGSIEDAKIIHDRLSIDPPEYIISIADDATDKEDCIETGYNIARSLGLNVIENVTLCFSTSGYLGIKKTETFEDNHPEVKSTVISCEPYNGGTYSYERTDSRDGLMKSNSQIIFIAPKVGFHINMQEEIKKMTESGMKAYFLGTSYNEGIHIMTNTDVITSGMIDYILDFTDSFNTKPNENVTYELIKYNIETKQYESMSYNDLTSTLDSIKIPRLEENNLDSFEVKEDLSKYSEKYKELNNLEKKEIPENSNYVYAINEMNAIRESIKNTSFINSYHNQTFRDDINIPGMIYNHLNTYYDTVGNLLNSLTLETNSVLSLTDAITQYEKEGNTGEIVLDKELKGFIPMDPPTEKEVC